MQGVAPPTGGSLTGEAKEEEDGLKSEATEEEVEDELVAAMNAHPMVFN